MAVANLLKLAVLLIGFFGYLTGSQQPSEDAPSVPHNYRNKRSIYLNSKAPVLIAAYITIPMSVALPGLRGRSARLQSNYNVTQVPYSYDDPKFASQLQKIDVYMDYLEIPDDMCRQRFICEVASSPTAYSPLYNVFEKQLSTELEVKKSYSSRYFRYFNALQEGKRSATENADDKSAGCRILYGTCPNDIEETINMDVLHIMQFLTQKFKIEFVDTTA
ncbi:uncharacterized protein LOC124337161 isoform X1 [Daphnia pulicaria]|uniref:uncharacterized protein LOC124337161 isoform X1 n=1 Tax=Daphnia pulicaria TaxID=35523 RepID=UPI001EEAC4EF|nr:uncharacterized protein LOC124337161 isoform X1 [Daphnia pulicaria]